MRVRPARRHLRCLHHSTLTVFVDCPQWLCFTGSLFQHYTLSLMINSPKWFVFSSWHSSSICHAYLYLSEPHQQYLSYAGSLNFLVTFSLTDHWWPHCFGENAPDQAITYIHYLQYTSYILYSLYILMWMLGWHVRSRLPALWCSQIVAPYVCQQACVQSRPLALWCSQIVVPYMCASRCVCSPGHWCCKICCWCHHTSPPYIYCLVMMPHGTIADSPSWATGLTGMYHTMGPVCYPQVGHGISSLGWHG